MVVAVMTLEGAFVDVLMIWVFDCMIPQVTGEIPSHQLMDQLAVLREGDLFCQWIPFVNRSRLLRSTKLELCVW